MDSFTQALGENREVINNALGCGEPVAALNETAPKLDVPSPRSRTHQGHRPGQGRADGRQHRHFTQTLSQRSPDVDKTIQEARSITEKLNNSADKIDSVLAGAENFLGSASGESGKGAFDEIRAAAVVRARARRRSELSAPKASRASWPASTASRIRACGNTRPWPWKAAGPWGHQPRRAQHRA